jgi:hypothetical protein
VTCNRQAVVSCWSGISVNPCPPRTYRCEPVQEIIAGFYLTLGDAVDKISTQRKMHIVKPEGKRRGPKETKECERRERVRDGIPCASTWVIVTLFRLPLFLAARLLSLSLVDRASQEKCCAFVVQKRCRGHWLGWLSLRCKETGEQQMARITRMEQERHAGQIRVIRVIRCSRILWLWLRGDVVCQTKPICPGDSCADRGAGEGCERFISLSDASKQSQLEVAAVGAEYRLREAL